MHFTIDSDNILIVHETAPDAEPDTIAVSTDKELRKATTNWPIARLVEVWNGFAGVVPLGDLKPVKKFTDRATALKHIWGAMQRLAENYNEEKQSRPALRAVGPQNRKANVKATAAMQAPMEKPAAPSPAPAPLPVAEPTTRQRRAGTQSAAVIELLERAGGASLEELCQASGWQKHTIRGFVSTLGKKDHQITSARRGDGARVYAMEE